eukprot:501778_1
MAEEAKQKDKHISFCMICCPDKAKDDKKYDPDISQGVDLNGGIADFHAIKKLERYLNQKTNDKYELVTKVSSKGFSDATATAKTGRTRIKQWLKSNKKTNQLVLYFSGHGSNKGIWFYDKCVRFDDLIKIINESGVKGYVTLILDCCQSGGIVKYLKKYLQSNKTFKKNMVVFFSAQADESCDDTHGGSVYSTILFSKPKHALWKQYFLERKINSKLKNVPLGNKKISGCVWISKGKVVEAK